MMLSSEDFYIENGLYVFTEKYHLKRGYCCKSGCRHCPWNYKKQEKGVDATISGKTISDQTPENDQ